MSDPCTNLKTEKTVAQMPDLIDTNDPYGNEDFITTQTDENAASLSTSTTSLINDFFIDGSATDVQNEEHKKMMIPLLMWLFIGKMKMTQLIYFQAWLPFINLLVQVGPNYLILF